MGAARVPFLAVLLLTLPLAVAGWSVPPNLVIEPSTPYDTPDVMWQDPDGAPGPSRLYFAAELIPYDDRPGHRRFAAWLGYWKDCNGDGLVGIGGGADPYPRAMLFDASVCPDATTHNQGGVVREFLWVGPGSHDVHDPDAKVWADWGLPSGSYPFPSAKSFVDDELVFHPDAAGPKWLGAVAWITSWTGDPVRLGDATLYANVPSAPASALPGGPHVYGAGCPVNWDCVGPWSSDVRVGDRYGLRDVDCYDASTTTGHC